MENRIDILLSAKDMATKTIQGVQKEIKSTEASISSFIKTNQQGFEKIRNLSGIAFGAMLLGANKAINNFSDLNESLNAVNVVFKGGSETIKKFGEQAAKTVGIANADFNQMAVITGALFQNVGKSEEEVAQMTIELSKRAADMASVFNTDVNDAMSAINQALRGETEAIRRYAGDVTDATLQEYLMAEGINKKVTEMSEAEKRLLRMDVLMKQTSVTQGDFANTSDQLANRQRILAADMENMSASIGKILLPAKELLVSVLGPLVSKMAEFARDNPKLAGTLIAVAVGVSGLVFAISAFLLIVPNIVAGIKLVNTAFTLLKVGIGPIGWALLALQVIMTALAFAWSGNWGGIQDKTKASIAWIRKGLESFGAWVYDFWQKWGGTIMAIVGAFWNYLRTYFAVMFKLLTGQWGDAWTILKEYLWSIFGDMITAASQWGGNLINTIIEGIKAKYTDFKNAILGVSGIISDYLGFHSPTKKGPGSDADTWMPNLVDMLVEGLTTGKALIQAAAEDLAKQIGGAFSKEKFDALKGNIVSFMEQANSVWNKMGENITNQKDKIKGLANEYKALQQQMKDMMAEVESLNAERSSTLAGRAYEIQKELAEMAKKDERTTEDNTKIDALNQELNFIKEQGVTEAEIFAARELANRTEAQRIVDSFNTRALEQQDKINKIAEEMKAKETQIRDEYAKYKEMVDNKKKLEKDYRELTHLYFTQQLSETQQLINAMKSLEAARKAAQGPTVSGARANGGPVSSGKTYLVGERGPELFTPSSSGNITPNNQLGGVNISINMGGVSVRNESDINGIAKAVADQLTRSLQLARLGVS